MPSWSKLSRHLFLEKKLDESRVRILRGQYDIVREYFRDKVWSREGVLSFFDYLLKVRGVKRSTCNSYLKLLKHIDSCKHTHILEGYSYFKEDPVTRIPLTPDEIEKLATTSLMCSNEKNVRDRVLIYTLALTGMRIQEVCDLTWDDYTGDRFLVRDSKTNEARQVPVPMFLRGELDTLLKHDHIFDLDIRITQQQVSKMLKNRAKKAGIKKNVFAHLFRHTLITQWIKDGHSIAKIARVVGHADLETTNSYVHLVIDDLYEMVESHPLVKEKETIETLGKKIHTLLEKLVDCDIFTLQEVRVGNKLTFDIERV